MNAESIQLSGEWIKMHFTNLHPKNMLFLHLVSIYPLINLLTDAKRKMLHKKVTKKGYLNIKSSSQIHGFIKICCANLKK